MCHMYMIVCVCMYVYIYIYMYSMCINIKYTQIIHTLSLKVHPFLKGLHQRRQVMAKEKVNHQSGSAGSAGRGKRDII